jgi:hypothetical protein
MNWSGHRFALGFFASVLIIWFGVTVFMLRQSQLADNASGQMLVVFDPGIEKNAAFNAITRAGANPIRETAFNFIWVVSTEAGGPARLKAQGALASYRELPISPSIAGCVAVADQKMSEALGL